MSLLEASLLRIADRLGLDRLAGDPTLARVALKDMFPDEPLVVSLLTAAVEHGALAALQDDDLDVPLAVLGPRLARGLGRDSGISEAGARWAVAAWAAAARRLPRPLPDLPDDRTDPADAGVFTVPRVTEPTTPSTDDEAAAAVPAATDDLETLIRTAPVIGESVPDAAAGVELDAASTHLRASRADDRDDEPKSVDGARDAAAPTLMVPAVADSVLSGEPAAASEADRAQPGAADGAPSDAAFTRLAASPAPVGSPEIDSQAPSAHGSAPNPVSSPAAAEAQRDDEPADEQVPAEHEHTARAAASPQDDRPPAPDRGVRPRPRRIALVAAAAAVLLLAGVGVTAFALRPPPALAIGTEIGNAIWTVDGHPAALAAGATLPAGAAVQVRTGPVELRAGASLVRLASGARARIENATTVSLLAGRAFVLAQGPQLTVRSTAGDATVSQGRALVGCGPSTCSVTALDAGTSVTVGHRTSTLAALQRSGAHTRSYVLADAIRADPWFTSNDALDRAQTRRPLGLTGPRVTGTWLLTQTRSDLPFTLSRTMNLGTDCSSEGCSVTVAIRMSDGVPQSRSAGIARPTSADGSRITVDYGSHSARCHWAIGTKKGQGVDGSETVTDTLRFQGSGAAETVTGERTTRYTATGSACATPAFTAAKTTHLAGARATMAELTDSAQATRWNEQQAKLNYVADDGSGCATSTTAPRAGLEADLRCAYPARGEDPTSVDLAVYGSSAQLRAAYGSATTGLVQGGTGDCTVGPCEGVAPNHYGRFLLTADAKGALLITDDPRAANLLLTARGPSMRGLARWWSTQQRTHSVYQASPIPHSGV